MSRNDKFLNIVSVLKDNQQPRINIENNIEEGLRNTYDNTGFKRVRCKRTQIDTFIDDLREDAPLLSGESYQRHEPQYFDEATYYNWFHKYIPQELLLSDCYLRFINLYSAGKNLQESVCAFLEVYDNQYAANNID